MLDLHDNGSATLSGVVTLDDAEPLAAWLRDTAKPRVNLRRCTHLHTAAVQALLMFRPRITAPPADHFLATRVMPLLRGNPSARGADAEQGVRPSHSSSDGTSAWRTTND